MNAVFERDYVAFSSSLRFLLLRGGFAAGMGLLFLLNILGAYGGNDWSEVGSTLLAIAVVLGVVLLALAAPGSFGTVLVHARATNSLPILLSTPLTARGIAFGAFGARAGLLMLLVIATWPPIALALLYGGIRGGQVLQATAAVTATVFLLGGPSFVISAFARRTASAVVTAYLVATALLAALWLLGKWAEIGTNDAGLAASISPYHAIRSALAFDVVEGSSVFLGVPGPYVLLLLAALLALASVLVASWRLAKEALGNGNASPLLLRRRCRPLRTQNPVLDHELRRGSLISRRSPARGLLALLIASEGGFIAAANVMDDPRLLPLHFGVLGFQLLLILLAVAAAGATALAYEKETNTLELLRAAPLPPAHVVVGKLAGVLRALLPCMLVPVLHLAYAAWIGIFSWLAIPALVLTGSVALAAWAIFALYQSLDQREPRRAVARTMTLLGIVAVLLAANLGYPAQSAFSSLDDYVGAGAAYGANPVAVILLPVALMRTGGDTFQTHDLAPPSPNDVFVGFFALIVWLVLYAAFGHALYRRLFSLYRVRFEG